MGWEGCFKSNILELTSLTMSHDSMGFPSHSFINKCAQKFSNRFSISAILSIHSFGNYLGIKRFLEVGFKIFHMVSSVLIERLLPLNLLDTRFRSSFIYWNSSPIFDLK